MSLYDELQAAKQRYLDNIHSDGHVPMSNELWDLNQLSISEDLHRIADALEPLNTMGDFNRNMGELREFFKTQEAGQ